MMRATMATKAFRVLTDLGAVASASARFDALVSTGPADRCLMWLGSKTDAGYGGFKLGGVLVMAHRYAFVRAFGAIAEGLEVDHRCRERGCVNPHHLRAVTHAENLKTRRHNTEPARMALAAARMSKERRLWRELPRPLSPATSNPALFLTKNLLSRNALSLHASFASPTPARAEGAR